MPNKLDIERVGGIKPEEKGSEDEAIPVDAALPNDKTRNPRRPALSKREMMEELSRARFPWEE